MSVRHSAAVLVAALMFTTVAHVSMTSAAVRTAGSYTISGRIVDARPDTPLGGWASALCGEIRCGGGPVEFGSDGSFAIPVGPGSYLVWFDLDTPPTRADGYYTETGADHFSTDVAKATRVVVSDSNITLPTVTAPVDASATGCVRYPPIVKSKYPYPTIKVPVSRTATRSVTVANQVSIENFDSTECGPSSFTLTLDRLSGSKVPLGWWTKRPTITITLAPGETRWLPVTGAAKPGAITGARAVFGTTVKNNATGKIVLRYVSPLFFVRTVP